MSRTAYEDEEKFDESREEDEGNGPNSVQIDMSNSTYIAALLTSSLGLTLDNIVMLQRTSQESRTSSRSFASRTRCCARKSKSSSESAAVATSTACG